MCEHYWKGFVYSTAASSGAHFSVLFVSAHRIQTKIGHKAFWCPGDMHSNDFGGQVYASVMFCFFFCFVFSPYKGLFNSVEMNLFSKDF